LGRPKHSLHFYQVEALSTVFRKVKCFLIFKVVLLQRKPFSRFGSLCVIKIVKIYFLASSFIKTDKSGIKVKRLYILHKRDCNIPPIHLQVYYGIRGLRRNTSELTQDIKDALFLNICLLSLFFLYLLL